MFWILALLLVVLWGVASVTSYSMWGFVLLWMAFALAALFVRLVQGGDEPA